MTRSTARAHAALVAMAAIADIEVESPAYSPRQRELVYVAVEKLKDRLRNVIRHYDRAGQKMKSRG